VFWRSRAFYQILSSQAIIDWHQNVMSDFQIQVFNVVAQLNDMQTGSAAMV
jgi:hypothetical protein